MLHFPSENNHFWKNGKASYFGGMMPASNNSNNLRELLLQVIDATEISDALQLITKDGRYKHATYHLQFRINKSTDVPFFQSTYPPAWIGRYVQQQYSEIDPIVIEGFKKEEAFNWADLTRATKEQEHFFEEAAEYGIGKCGASFPVTDKSLRQALFSVTSDCDPEEWKAQFEDERDDISKIAEIIHRKAVVSLNKENNDISLSPRELECLNWTAQGKDSPSIALILGISEYTVRDYIKSARHKLGCSTIAQAVYEATRRRMIDI